MTSLSSTLKSVPLHWLALGAASAAWLAAAALRWGASSYAGTRGPREQAGAFAGCTAPVWVIVLAAAGLAAAAGEWAFTGLWGLWLWSMFRRYSRIGSGLLDLAGAFSSARFVFILALAASSLTYPAIRRRVLAALPPQMVDQLPGAFVDFSKAVELKPSDVPGLAAPSDPPPPAP